MTESVIKDSILINEPSVINDCSVINDSIEIKEPSVINDLGVIKYPL